MDLSADNYKSDEQHHSHPFLYVMLLLKDLISRLARFFTITEEEQLTAGIIFRARGHD